MRRLTHLILVVISSVYYSSCVYKDKSAIVPLSKIENPFEVVYRTEVADFYFDKQNLIEYCREQDNGKANDFAFPQIIGFIESYDGNPVIIPDTLGTKLVREGDVSFNESDSLIRVRDSEHDYAYITDDLRWAIIDIARKGDVRIYHTPSSRFLDTVIVNDINTDWYGDTNISLTNNTIIFSEMRWIR